MKYRPAVLFAVILGSFTFASVALVFIFQGMMGRHEAYVEPRKPQKLSNAISELGSLEPGLISSQTAFAFRLGEALSYGRSGKNECVSPYATNQAVCLLLNGSQGKTFDACAKVLGLSDPNTERLNQSNSLVSDVIASLRNSPITVANSVWNIVPARFNPRYSEDMGHYYDADIRKIGSAGENALKQINDWASDKTKGTIPQVIDSIDRSAQFVLIGLVTIDTSWEKPFETAIPAPFQAQSGTIQAPMMQAHGVTLRYFEDDSWRACAVPCSQKSLSLWFILSKSKEAQKLSLSMWQKIVRESKPMTVDLSVPKFKFSSVTNLVPPISTLGGASLFAPGNDFAPMSHQAGSNFGVSQFIQKCLVDVNEFGMTSTPDSTDGPAKAEIKTKSRSVIIDRPFRFLVTESNTESIVFYGFVSDPTR